MPYKSKAQIKKFFALEEEGKLKKGTAERWAKETKGLKKLPERVTPKRKITSIAQLKKLADSK